MQARIDYYKVSSGGYKALLGLDHYLASSSLEKNLLHLIKLRVAQVNGCAFCLDMHWKDLQAEGESEQRMYSLDAWRETPTTTGVNAPPWRGRKRSPTLQTGMRRTNCTRKPVGTLASRNWPI
jgi:AhpD family alkylhydroperoxidase